jgi:hypothetical protein
MSAELRWKRRRGIARAAEVSVGGMTIRAEEVLLESDRWVLKGVSLELCHELRNVLGIEASQFEFDPSNRIVGRRVAVELFGSHVLTLARTQGSLGPAARGGIGLPTPYFSSGLRPGLKWSPEVPIGSDTLVAASADIPSGRAFSGQLYLVQSLASVKPGAFPVHPLSELQLPFPFSFLDSVEVRSADRFRDFAMSPRASLSVGSTKNQRGQSVQDSFRASKPWDVVFEFGTTESGFALHTQIRHHEIAEVGGDTQVRTVGTAILQPPSVALAPQTRFELRFDARSYQQSGSDFGWFRGFGAVVWEPSDKLRVAFGYADGAQGSKPAFEFDAVSPLRSWIARLDVEHGPRSVAYLAKYDPSQRKWFDQEIMLRQAAGCFDLYATYRTAPKRFSFGIEFRALEAIERALKRVSERGDDNRPPSP